MLRVSWWEEISAAMYDLQYGSVEQMLIGHLYDMDIPVCCGFPVGSNSCLPLLEGAPCSLDVTPDDALLSFDVELQLSEELYQRLEST